MDYREGGTDLQFIGYELWGWYHARRFPQAISFNSYIIPNKVASQWQSQGLNPGLFLTTVLFELGFQLNLFR